MEHENGVEVPMHQVSEDALNALIEAFVLREGTDYGAVEVSLAAKTAEVRRQMEKGDVVIFYDPADDSCTLQRKDELKCHRSTSSRN